ncbi:MAG: Uma2 family endonuclease [Thermoanaerobaculia bacterium]
MAPQTSTKLTYEDYLLLPDDGRRHELIDGEHYVSPSPNTQHQRISKRFTAALLACEDAGFGELFYAPYDVVLSIFDVVQPDVLFITPARAHIINDKHAEGAPDLVIEILSDSNRQYDEQVKYKTYERLGVGEYWIADPFEKTVRVFRRTGERFARIAVGEIITTPLLPSFELRVADLFA